MNQILSKDGTAIAYDQRGHGPPIVLVMGAFNTRSTGGALATHLAAHFSVFCYDRRGRGESGDAPAYRVEREVEDLEAVISATGGSASVFGFSSGAALALEAASCCPAITKLMLYELPPAQSGEHPAKLEALVAAGRRGEAVEYFQRYVVGIPEHIVAELRHAPFRPALEAMAHTLAYDATLVSEGRLSADLLARVCQPTLAIAGGASPPFMREVAAQVARSLPNASAVTIDGATHHLDEELLGPVLEEFAGTSSKR